MATMVATRRNTVIQRFYERLVKAGKSTKVALTACMRKRLTMLEAMVESKTRWIPSIA
jgi:transposase